MKSGKEREKRPVARRRIKLTAAEKAGRFLWALLCVALVGVFVYMTWFMYNPKNRLAHNLKYGQQYLASANYSRAVWEFRRVLAMDEHNADAYRGLMEVAIRSEDTDEALSLYSRAGDILSGYEDPLLSLLELRAVERLEQGDYDGAFSVAVTVEASTGDSNAASLIRALVIDGMLDDAKKAEPADALAIYRRLLRVDNIDAAAVYALMAQLYNDSGDPDGALAILDEGIEATGAESLTELRGAYVRQFAETFLPDTFIRSLNEAMADADFAAATEIVQHELFLFRIAEYGLERDEFGEQGFDFSEIQPADMNTTMYAEYNARGRLLMIIVDWERETSREAVFNELVYVPSTGEVHALSQKQRVTDANTLADEGHYYRLADGELREITQSEYFDSLTAVFSEQFSAQLSDEEFDFDFSAYTGEDLLEEDGTAAVLDSGGTERDAGAVETVPAEDEDADSGAVRTGGVA